MTRIPSHSASDRDLLERAYRLAYFMHPDSTAALRVASGALSRLDAVATAQDKRRYYMPRGGRLSRRNKVVLSKPQLLQCLVYHQVESNERNGSATGEDDMVRRFVTHLVQLTLLRNSFYVTLGVSQVLHDYSTAETMAIYERLVGDPDRFKEAFYYRSRKRQLIKELGRRFERQIVLCRGARREKRFEAHPEPGRFRPLVRSCLEWCTPWDTTCPDGFGPAWEDTAAGGCQARHPDDEHLLEVQRMHAVLHPDCFARLTRSIGLEDPERRLVVPRFVTARRGSRTTAGHPPAPPLSDEQRQSVYAALAQQQEQRRFLSPGRLVVLVTALTVTLLAAGHLRRYLSPPAAPPPGPPVIDEPIRGPELFRTPVTLQEVRRIFVADLGTGLTTLERDLVAELSAAGALEPVASPGAADAVLKLDSEATDLTLQLVNRTGEVLWRRGYPQVDSGLAARVVRDLERETRSEGGQH